MMRSNDWTAYDPTDRVRTGWARTELRPQEREELCAALTAEQREHLLVDGYVWVKGIGVLWTPSNGRLRRARFTHGIHFETEHGEFYVDSEGNTRQMRAAPVL